MTTNLTYLTTFPIAPSKKQILERLFMEGNITFDELWVLTTNEIVQTQYIPPYVPDNPQWVTTTNDSNNP